MGVARNKFRGGGRTFFMLYLHKKIGKYRINKGCKHFKIPALSTSFTEFYTTAFHIFHEIVLSI